jgi:hypothetical protein
MGAATARMGAVSKPNVVLTSSSRLRFPLGSLAWLQLARAHALSGNPVKATRS